MALVIETDCNNCNKRKSVCCKNCFDTNETSIFIPLSEKELEFLMEEKKLLKYNPGETIIKQNTSTTSVFCIKSGLAKIYVESNSGKNVIVKIVSQGDIITGGGLFNGNVHHFSLKALTPVECCAINSANVTTLFSENNQFALKLVQSHTRQNNYLLEKLVNHTQKYMPGRVADTLLYLKNQVFKENPFKVPLTRQDLAEMSNMTKESFVRILHEFKASGSVKTSGNVIEIINESSLKEISEIG